MTEFVLKVPLGPEAVLRGGEIGPFFRHRYMIFLYFALAIVGLIGTAGDGNSTPPEILFALATVEVVIGVAAMLCFIHLKFRLAQLRGVVMRVHLGRFILVGTLTAVGLAEFVDTYYQGQVPTPARFLALQVVFYGVLALLMFSVVLQFAMNRMLFDLRGGATGARQWPQSQQGG